jgi:hypothetical protein
MSDKESQVDDKCRACRGTGSAAGARPVRKGPFLLNPPLCQVCGGTGRKPPSLIDAVEPEHSKQVTSEASSACPATGSNWPPGVPLTAARPE